MREIGKKEALQKYIVPVSSGISSDGFLWVNGARLTIRELDIIAYLCNDRTGSKNIAAALSISPRTAENHIRSIFAKTQSRSRESVIDFIRKSDKSVLIQQHYQTLQNQVLLQKVINHVRKEVKSQSSTCLIVYDQAYKPSSDAAAEVKEFLTQVGLNNVEEVRNLTNSVIGEPPPEGIDKVLYILTDALLLERQAVPNAGINKDLPDSNLLILVDRKENTPLPKNRYIELKEGATSYVELTSFLRLLTPAIKWKALTPQLHKELKDLEKLASKGPPSQPELEQTPPSKLNDRLPIKLFSNKTLLLVGLIIVSVLSIPLILFINNYKKPSYDKNRYPTSSSAIHSDLAIPMEPALLNRPDLLNQISEKLESPQGTQGIILVGIAGMGGVGKTTIARQFGRLYKASAVWEINAETYTTLMSSFKDLAYELAETNEKKKQLTFIENIGNEEEKKKQLVSFVKQHLRERPNWLLIYDNVDTFATVKPYLPNDPKIWGYGKVIITTTDANIKHTNSIPSEQIIHIEELTEQECLTLFSKILYRKESS